ncbi:MAG TPA: glucosyl-3-phosphoglycerate synthase, partial [Solirubrobacteraceae bacterium]|nr:glucosyl-3-phosphoglycerate synthase [Solirubrobacteraceae bacterium]
MSAVQSWYRSNSFDHRDFPAGWLAAERSDSISVCVPARETAETIGPIVQTLVSLRERGVLDQVVVVDAGSVDGTAALAASLGAEVHQDVDLLPETGPVLGKGDAIWRALSVLTGDLVCFLDSDTADFGEHFACGLLGPLVARPELSYVKAFYRRPFRVGEVVLADGGGRVNELVARPLLSMFYPELAGVRQPLAGEMAGRRERLERLPFACGYAVETGLLIDVYREAGLAAIAQVDLD